MANKKKRTTLDALVQPETVAPINEKKQSLTTAALEERPETSSKIAKTTVYAPQVVYEQWRELAFTERKKMHDYLMEGLDLVFKKRGLKSISELTGEK
jgi:hypothetical protein